MLLFKTDKK